MLRLQQRNLSSLQDSATERRSQREQGRDTTRPAERDDLREGLGDETYEQWSTILRDFGAASDSMQSRLTSWQSLFTLSENIVGREADEELVEDMKNITLCGYITSYRPIKTAHFFQLVSPSLHAAIQLVVNKKDPYRGCCAVLSSTCNVPHTF